MNRAFIVIGTLGICALGIVMPAAAQQAAKGPPLARKVACIDEAKQKGLRGTELKDDVVTCMKQAKVDCVKQAVAQKVQGPDRKAFVLSCLDRKS